jgi:hypothetical protein
MMNYDPEKVDSWVKIIRFTSDFHGCKDIEEEVLNFNERQVLMEILSGKVGCRSGT